MYKIKVEYETGDSFGSEDVEKILDLSWTNIDYAKESLKRIETHYKWFEKYIEYEYECHVRPTTAKIPEMPNFIKKMKNLNRSYNLFLVNDLGEDVMISVSWCGYFETLYGASIIGDHQDGWSFSLE
jgi:hypothetical protein